MVELTCQVCGKIFHREKSSAEGQKTCSYKCMGISYRKEGNPMWRGGKQTKRCEYCWKEYETHQKAQRFCSPRCQSESYGLKTGPASPAWRGGRIVCNGYVQIYKPEHPNSYDGGYVLEHRLIMEQHLERYLESNEVVHHVNGNTQDNRIENLELLESRSEHAKIHQLGER